jgi:hypothetical protein
MLNQFRSLSRRRGDKQIAVVIVTVDCKLCPSTVPLYEGVEKRLLGIWIIKQQPHNMLVFTNPKTVVPRVRHMVGRHNIHALLHRNYRNQGNLNVTSITIYTELPFVLGVRDNGTWCGVIQQALSLPWSSLS